MERHPNTIRHVLIAPELSIRFLRSTTLSEWIPSQPKPYGANHWTLTVLEFSGTNYYREGRKWAQPAWWHSSSLGRYLTEEWRLPQERVHCALSSIQHAWSMHGTDWQLRLPNKIMSLKKERLYRKRYTDSIKKEGLFSLLFDNHFLFKGNEPCKHLSCFVSLFFAISLNSIVWLFF